MHEWQSLSQVRWDGKYHVVIIPKYRKRNLYGELRKRVGEVIRELCRQRGIELMEGHLMPDHGGGPDRERRGHTLRGFSI